MDRNEFIASIITTAVESGIDYWAAVRNYKWQLKSMGGKEDKASAVVIDAEGDGTSYFIDHASIETALAKMGERPVVGLHEDHRGHIIAADKTSGEYEYDIDSTYADIIVQFACFGEVIYG